MYETPVDWHGDYGKVTLPRMQEYASRVGADFQHVDLSFCPPVIQSIKEKYKNHEYKQKVLFWCCTVGRMFLHHEFLKTDYERMLILDADILVRRDAENIFEEESYKSGISMVRLFGYYDKHIKHDIKLVYNEQVDKTYYGPMLLSDKDTSRKLVENFFEDEVFYKTIETSLKYENEKRGSVGEDFEMENPNAPKIGAMMEEHLYPYLFKRAEVYPNEIFTIKWLEGPPHPDNPWRTEDTMNANMWHFAGPDKKFLSEEDFVNSF
jgi:hypothetical protein